MLPSKKVFPQEVAAAEEAGQQGQGLFVLEHGQRFSALRGSRLLQNPIQKLVEVFDCFPRVRGPRQHVGELLDEDRGGSQFLLRCVVQDLLPLSVTDIETVM